MKACLALLLLILPLTSLAQKKRLDLDDLMIRGELHNDDRLSILARQKNELKNIIKFRKDYRQEILQQLPPSQPKRKF